MPVAEFRFYEELNDFLPPERRKRPFPWRCAPGTTVKHAIEALGVPHTEVELILVDGESVDFSRPVRDRERIAVYPRFESFDVRPLLRLRPRPLRNPTFLADVHLGGLARYLRMLGFDARIRDDRPVEEAIRVAASEHRILLTRSRRLLLRAEVTHGCFVHAEDPLAQCREIVCRLQLQREARPLTRCLRCNRELEEVDAERVVARLEPATRRHFERFRRCPECGRVYWEGSHWRRMSRIARELLADS